MNASGYNSGDEYGPCDSGHTSEAEWLEVCNFSLCHIISLSSVYYIICVLLLFYVQRDRWFEKSIGRKGFVIKQMEQDGACLFRAVADQVYGDQEMHAIVRSHCMDYIVSIHRIKVILLYTVGSTLSLICIVCFWCHHSV